MVTTTRASKPIITWPILPDDFELPEDPVDDLFHPLLASALRQPLTAFTELMQNALVVSNFALCAAISWESATNKEASIICTGPDWMYVRPVKPWNNPEPRRSYTPHTEGTIPQVVMEFLSYDYGKEYSFEHKSRVGKWYFYEQIVKIPTYVIFSGTTGYLEVYYLESERYQIQEADANGRYWIPGLDLFLGVWEGNHDARTGYWLRWWNAQGELLLWSEERLEQARKQAEEAHQQAEEAHQQAEEARQQAEEAYQRAEAMAERRRHLGVDLDP